MKNYELEFEEPLYDILNTYKQGSSEPLDGDEVDTLTEHLRNRLNLIEGNLTKQEYEQLEEVLNHEHVCNYI